MKKDYNYFMKLETYDNCSQTKYYAILTALKNEFVSDTAALLK